MIAMWALARGIFDGLPTSGAKKTSRHLASLAVPMFDRSVPKVGSVERREHRNAPPAYSQKVFYSAGRPTSESRAYVRRHLRAAPSVQSWSSGRVLM